LMAIIHSKNNFKKFDHEILRGHFSPKKLILNQEYN
jgi:hypothetical protein